MEKAYGASVYVSYARADETRLKVVDKIKKEYQGSWVNLKVDEDVIKPRQSFKEFIEEIGKADSVIVLFSDAYFKSFYCMLELTRIIEFGNDKGRVFPVFLDDFRLDGKNRDIKSSWQKKLKQGQQPYDESLECSEEYGSEAECQSIVDSCDKIYKNFAHELAYKSVDIFNGDCKEIIQWSKERHLTTCKNNPIFEKSINHLSNSNSEVKDVLIKQIKDKEIGYTDSNIIACLIQNHPIDLLKVIADAQSTASLKESKRSLSILAKLLFPLLFDPSYLSIFNLKLEKEQIKIISIPYATSVSAEVLMASFDSRELELYVRKISERSDAVESFPGKYHLGSPPEGGENADKTRLEDTKQHLIALTGGTAEPSNKTMENWLFDNFASLKQKPAIEYPEEIKKKRINRALEKINAHYYLILPLNQDKTWDEFAETLSKNHSKIIVLQLENDDDKEEKEVELFDHLHHLFSY